MNATSTFLKSGTEGAIAFRRMFKPIAPVELWILFATQGYKARSLDFLTNVTTPGSFHAVFEAIEAWRRARMRSESQVCYVIRSDGLRGRIADSYDLKTRVTIVDESGRGGVLCGTR